MSNNALSSNNDDGADIDAILERLNSNRNNTAEEVLPASQRTLLPVIRDPNRPKPRIYDTLPDDILEGVYKELNPIDIKNFIRMHG